MTESAPDGAGPRGEPLSLLPMKILFVDDMATVRLLYGKLLQDAGYQVLLAGSMAEALEVARQEQPRLAIIDCHMPDGDGVELTRRLVAQPENADVLVVMHSQSKDEVEPSLAAGAIDLIFKDDPREVFLMRVAALRRFIEAQAAQRRAENENRERTLETIQRLRQVEEQARVELEERVLERTRELTAINERFEAEMRERTRAETDLRLAHKVFDNTSEAIMLTDPQGVIVDINPAFTIITGYTREEAVGENPRKFKSGCHNDGFYAEMWRAIAETGSWQGEVWDRRKSGDIYPKRLAINAVYDADGRIEHYIGIFTDISETKDSEQKLQRLAYFDPLTKLPNRVLFRERLEHEVLTARRHGQKVGLCFIDLDRFKHVNDTLGHSAGDELLQRVAERLLGCVRANDTVARMGGDEFTMILTDIDDEESVARVARKVLMGLQQQMEIKGHEIYVGASIGIAIYPDNGGDFETLTKNADLAMYRAKERGRGNAAFYSDEMNTRTSELLALEARLRRAVEEEQLILHYQPKMDLCSGRLVGMEALVRWQPPDGPMIMPTEFVPMAEETGLVLSLGRWVMARAAADCLEWVRQGYSLRVAINLSPREFQDHRFLDSVDTVLTESGLPPEHFEVEITESLMMRDVDGAIQTLHALRARGITISMDDFGTGFSSLNYLKQFPIHALKIDRSFVRDVPGDPNDVAIVKAILSLAAVMKLKVVAEGVENAEQLAFLQRNLCDEMQGYYYSKPMSKDDFGRFLRECGDCGRALLSGELVRSVS